MEEGTTTEDSQLLWSLVIGILGSARQLAPSAHFGDTDVPAASPVGAVSSRAAVQAVGGRPHRAGCRRLARPKHQLVEHQASCGSSTR